MSLLLWIETFAHNVVYCSTAVSIVFVLRETSVMCFPSILQIVRYNQHQKLWEPLLSHVSEDDGLVIAETSQLGYFAVASVSILQTGAVSSASKTASAVLQNLLLVAAVFNTVALLVIDLHAVSR